MPAGRRSWRVQNKNSLNGAIWSNSLFCSLSRELSTNPELTFFSFFFFYFSALLSHTGTAWMNTPKLLYLCASCYYSITYQRVSVMFACLHVCACTVTKTFNHVRNNWASPDSRYKNKNEKKKKNTSSKFKVHYNCTTKHWFMCQNELEFAFFFLGRIFIYLFLLLLPLSCCWRMNKTMNPNWLLIEHFCSLSFHLAYSLQTTSLNQTFPSHWQTRNRFAFWGIICYIPSRADKMITLALSLCLYRTAGAFPLVRALQLLLVVIVTISIRARKCTA